MEKYLNQKITLFCCRYIYTGILVEVTDTYVTLKDPYIVYETGPFNSSDWHDAQRLPKDIWSIMLAAVESFGDMK